jgi:polyisoprenoid-binding protein YceI
MKLSGKIGVTLAACMTVLGLTAKPASGQTPVFVISPEQSTIKFYVKSSVDIQGDFNKWDATLTFTTPKVSTGVLDIEIQAASVNTGSDMKDGKLVSVR